MHFHITLHSDPTRCVQSSLLSFRWQNCDVEAKWHTSVSDLFWSWQWTMESIVVLLTINFPSKRVEWSSIYNCYFWVCPSCSSMVPRSRSWGLEPLVRCHLQLRFGEADTWLDRADVHLLAAVSRCRLSESFKAARMQTAEPRHPSLPRVSDFSWELQMLTSRSFSLGHHLYIFVIHLAR